MQQGIDSQRHEKLDEGVRLQENSQPVCELSQQQVTDGQGREDSNNNRQQELRQQGSNGLASDEPRSGQRQERKSKSKKKKPRPNRHQYQRQGKPSAS